MLKDERDLLEVLKFELKFLEDGGYGRSPSARWRPQLIFEDSPTCMNVNCEEHGPCTDCVLIHLVPPEFRSAEIPCRHIPMNSSGETLDSLYRHDDQGEIEDVVGSWLRKTIARLEKEREVARRTLGTPPTQSWETLKGTPPYQKQHELAGTFDRTTALHPKCANRACPTAFHWTGGGKFFRFRPDTPSQSGGDAASDPPVGIHGVRHYWLCERCSQMFTLVYDEQCGVVLKVLWPELPMGQTKKELSEA